MKTQEKQYQFLLEGPAPEALGLMSGQVWRDDPRRLTFLLSRYKFVSKMFSGMDRVLEVGCADGFGTRIVRQEVAYVVALDFDPIFIEDARSRNGDNWSIRYEVHDMLSGPYGGDFDGAYCCDVLEHIKPSDEDLFASNLAQSIKGEGCVIVGSPSRESQTYASKASREGHVNCKTGEELRGLMKKYFHNVFIFSMNDEVVHTGFQPMAHYLFALCCNVREFSPLGS